MKNLIGRSAMAATVFVGGGLHLFQEQWALSTVVGAGIYQGLKYNGSFKRGLKTSAAVGGALFVVNGLYNVALQSHTIMTTDFEEV